MSEGTWEEQIESRIKSLENRLANTELLLSAKTQEAYESVEKEDSVAGKFRTICDVCDGFDDWHVSACINNKKSLRTQKEAEIDGCPICGGAFAYIRGRFPGHDKRKVCPTCAQEKLDSINSVLSDSVPVCA